MARPFLVKFLYYRPHPKDGGRYCFQFVSSHLDPGGGGYPIQPWTGGVPGLRFGGVPSLRSGGVPSLRSGGGPGLRPMGGGGPSKGKNF